MRAEVAGGCRAIVALFCLLFIRCIIGAVWFVGVARLFRRFTCVSVAVAALGRLCDGSK